MEAQPSPSGQGEKISEITSEEKKWEKVAGVSEKVRTFAADFENKTKRHE
jgi:hypothetical protein